MFFGLKIVFYVDFIFNYTNIHYSINYFTKSEIHGLKQSDYLKKYSLIIICLKV